MSNKEKEDGLHCYMEGIIIYVNNSFMSIVSLMCDSLMNYSLFCSVA